MQEWLILLEMQHTDSIHAFRMADKIARKEVHRQVFVGYVNESAHNSRDASFLSDEDFTEIVLPQYSPLEIKILY